MTDQQPVLMSPQGSLPVLQKWFGDVIVKLWDSTPWTSRRNDEWMLTGCPVWGEQYVNTLLNWCIPTMIAPENIKALDGTWLVFFTDAPGYARILDSLRPLEEHGITPVLYLMPDDVLAELGKHPSHRYWGLGTAHNILVRMAHRARTGFHMMAPDHLYGQDYFPNLKRLSKQYGMVIQTGISAMYDGAVRELQQYRHDRGWLAVPDRALGTIAWHNLHPQTRAYVMNNARIPDSMPLSHFMCWQGRDAIHTYCCHQNVAWLSPDLCRRSPNFMPATIDTRLPHLAKDFYVPTVDDQMTFIEISDGNKAAQDQPVGKDMFLARAWSQVGLTTDYMSYFRQPSLTPIDPQMKFMTDEEIAAQHQAVTDLMWAEKPPAWLATMQRQIV